MQKGVYREDSSPPCMTYSFKNSEWSNEKVETTVSLHTDLEGMKILITEKYEAGRKRVPVPRSPGDKRVSELSGSALL